MELVGCRSNDGLNLFVRREGEAMEDLALESTPRRFRLGFGPVYTGEVGMIVSAIGILLTVYDHASVKKRRSDRPQDRGQSPRLTLLARQWLCAQNRPTYRQQVVDMDNDFRLLQ